MPCALDSAARRLYAVRQGGVDIYNVDDGSLVGELAIAGEFGDILLVPALGKAFATAVAARQIIIFDLDTLKRIGTAPLPEKPRSISYDSKSGRLFVTSITGGALAAIDAKTGRLVGSLTLGGDLRDSVADGRGHLFVADKDAKAIHVVDTARLASLGQVSVWPGGGPTALINDEKERRIYVATDNGRMVIIDPDQGQMVGYVPIGEGDAGMAANFLPARLTRMFVGKRRWNADRGPKCEAHRID